MHLKKFLSAVSIPLPTLKLTSVFLVGRWDENYSDGTPPFEWTGSVAILEEYMKNGGKTPVKYGQCWVFAGLTTTICR